MAGSPSAPGLGVGVKGLETDRCGRGSGSSHGAVSQWVSRARDGGAEALRCGEPPGGQSKLNAAQLNQSQGETRICVG